MANALPVRRSRECWRVCQHLMDRLFLRVQIPLVVSAQSIDTHLCSLPRTTVCAHAQTDNDISVWQYVEPVLTIWCSFSAIHLWQDNIFSLTIRCIVLFLHKIFDQSLKNKLMYTHKHTFSNKQWWSKVSHKWRLEKNEVKIWWRWNKQYFYYIGHIINSTSSCLSQC